MNPASDRRFRTKRLKYVVALRRERPPTEDVLLPYLGLEHIESETGQLVQNLDVLGESASQASDKADSLSYAFDSGDVLFGKLRPLPCESLDLPSLRAVVQLSCSC